MKKKVLTYFIILAFIALFLLEAFLAFMYYVPSCTIHPFDNYMYNIYLLVFRNVIQYDKECACYDPEISYKLRRGECTFSNVEFSNIFHINSLGVRDDEDSLISPHIIIAGDSEAMGWGVGQDETYAEIIEKRTGKRVLNAAVSSYGTVREVRILNSVDTSNLKYLIIHYKKNDLLENMIYYSNNNSLEIMSEKKYNTLVSSHDRWKKYYPGKYTVFFLKLLAKSILFEKFDFPKTEGLSCISIEAEAMFFLNAILGEAHFTLSGVDIIVLGEETFLKALNQEMQSHEYPDYIRRIITLNELDNIDDSCTYKRDEHLNAKGHRIIADNILIFINSAY